MVIRRNVNVRARNKMSNCPAIPAVLVIEKITGRLEDIEGRESTIQIFLAAPSGLGSFLPSFWGGINLTVVKRCVFKPNDLKKGINDRPRLCKTKKGICTVCGSSNSSVSKMFCAIQIFRYIFGERYKNLRTYKTELCSNSVRELLIQNRFLEND